MTRIALWVFAAIFFLASAVWFFLMFQERNPTFQFVASLSCALAGTLIIAILRVDAHLSALRGMVRCQVIERHPESYAKLALEGKFISVSQDEYKWARRYLMENCPDYILSAIESGAIFPDEELHEWRQSKLKSSNI